MMEIMGRISKHQWGIIYGGGGDSPTLTHCDYKDPVKIMIDKDNNKMVVDWPNGAKGDYVKAEEGDGLKIYPNPARENSGGTVQKGSTNALNTHTECGSGTVDGLRIRYLTPRECLRLQAFPDDAIDRLEAVLSKSALYKVAGNSIAVCCLKAIFKGIYIDGTFRKGKQMSLSDYLE